MPALKNRKHEHFAQLIYEGNSQTKAYGLAGFSPHGSHASTLANSPSVKARVAELFEHRRETERKANERAVSKLALSKEWILERLMWNAERALRGKPLVDRNGIQTGQFTGKPEGSVANRALELLGNHLGMWIHRVEEGQPGDFARLPDDKLDAEIDAMAQELGFKRSDLQPKGVTEH